MWVESTDDLKCMCRALAIIVWETINPGKIITCDTREYALQELAAKNLQ